MDAMPHIGQVIEGSEGVRATVMRADREAYEVEFVYPPGSGNRVGPHLHTRQTESFEVLDGRVRYVLDGAEKGGPGKTPDKAEG